MSSSESQQFRLTPRALADLDVAASQKARDLAG
jgi:hypothetical protein